MRGVWSPTPGRRPILGAALLALLGGIVVAETSRIARHDLAWPDEFIYLVGARNLVERGTLNTNFYLFNSLVVRGYPHRDVHMPGYVIALTPFVAAMGASLAAAAALNVACFLGSILLVYALARRLLAAAPALAAAALFTALPPFPGYLWIANPELLVSAVFLALIAWLLSGSGPWRSAAAGAMFAGSLVFRESLVLGFPFVLAYVPRRSLLRVFLPSCTATLLLVVWPLSRNRAVHPNSLFPSMMMDALRSESPIRAAAGAVLKNAGNNLTLTAGLTPLSWPEDAMLAFLAVLALAAAIGALLAPCAERRFSRATFASLGLVVLAMYSVYVVRVRGGVWGGVRALMPWAPLLLILATPLLFKPRWPWLRAVLLLAVFIGFVALDRHQIRFFNRYKGTDLEDQDRHLQYMQPYLDRFQPHRVGVRNFKYGFTHYPVEVVWGLPRDGEELRAFERAIDYEFLVVHWKSPLRLFLIRNPRYARINKQDRDAELLIWRRLY